MLVIQMKKIAKNKASILTFYKCISGVTKTQELLLHFTDDTNLIEHLLYMESLLPCFTLLIDEITAEGSRVFVRARCKGKQTSELNGNPPTFKEIEFPYAIGYYLSGGRITDHWMIADQMSLLQQLDSGCFN